MTAGPDAHGGPAASGETGHAGPVVGPADLAVLGPGAGAPLDRAFFDRPSPEVAADLLGRVVAHGPVAVRLTEVEAYGGPGQDPAAHTYRGRTPRNAVMFGEPGHLYVYFTYGMHFCANLVCLPEGRGSAVLMRAGEVIAGADLVRARRLSTGGKATDDPGAGESRTRPGGGRSIPDRDLARGPARLAVALGFERRHNGLDCCAQGPIRVFAGRPADPALIRTGPRTGVSSGAETPWRFWIDGDPTVSPYRPHVPRRRGRTEGPQPEVR
ncbi:DNA-3-methyladenine glycosylase [Microtetraspora malaysiensis]|uniref:DNA-3-methyladenine glycosylase n=1 Tax=Microtetraspora malaysiensis TaxID=161358 RepID=UPI003D94EC63